MPFPSTLSSFTDPSPSDKLSTTPHSSIETAQNTGIKELQAFIGAQSSLVGTLYYDIRGAGSNGGGHVQTANKGGTGQTAYTKGDILVATSSSVLAKLAVSANDNDFLAVNSSVAAGVNWLAGVTSGQIQNMSFSNATDTGTGSVYSISPVPCVLSYTHGQVFTFRANASNTIAAPALNVSSLVSKLIKNPDSTALNVGQIVASAMTMIQYDGQSSVFQLLSQKAVATAKVATGQTTIAAGTTSEQLIAHGLGVTPTLVQIYATRKDDDGTDINISHSFGTGTSTSAYNCTYASNSATGTTGGKSTTGQVSNAIISLRDASDGADVSGTLTTLNSTNIGITCGTNESNTNDSEVFIQWTAFR